MARVSKVILTNTHRTCRHCKVVEKEFLSVKGEPILGECEYAETRFILNEKTDCKKYERV